MNVPINQTKNCTKCGSSGIILNGKCSMCTHKEKTKDFFKNKQSYEECIEDICVISFLKWNHNKPMETLSKIIANEVSNALDPMISQIAIDLIEKHGGTFNRETY